MRVPRVLHQIWLQGGLIPGLAIAARSVAQAAGWGYEIWSAADVGRLGWASQVLFRALSPRCLHIAQQSNILRYLVLRDQGGLYLDTDIDLQAMPEDLTDAWMARCHGRYGVSGFALAAPAGHLSIERLVRNLAVSNLMQHASAGSALLSRNTEGFNLWPIKAWREEDDNPATYGHHLCSGRASGTFICPPMAVPA